ncbi:hypothetical protein niasHS_014409 [Heterodera schachtii]|uniref:Very-long-chain (3R)-3-hydroxyacyl-CoA dehydratase n=1 Tax=Heterodera schachtii TaxID=97005 RepID=A0ABD2I4E7_HETSC
MSTVSNGKAESSIGLYILPYLPSVIPSYCLYNAAKLMIKWAPVHKFGPFKVSAAHGFVLLIPMPQLAILAFQIAYTRRVARRFDEKSK